MMHTFALTADEFAPMYRFFEPVTLADQVRNMPLLIYAVFFLSARRRISFTLVDRARLSRLSQHGCVSLPWWACS